MLINPTANQVFVLTNDARGEYQLHLIRWNDRIAMGSQAHANRMAKKRTMAHWGIQDGLPGDRLVQYGYRFMNMSENIAMGQTTAERVVQAWLADPPHAVNVLGNYLDMGCGYATDTRGRTYWCCDYANPST
jgi:uncharacterized protein YkwD